MKRHPFLLGFLIVGVLIAAFVGLAFLAVSLVSDREPAALIHSGDSVGVIEVLGVVYDSKKTVEDLVRFRDDDKIKAIVLRVDSPGGGVAPSQEIYQEVRRTKEKKPVVSSMGSIAASGGYYIACAGDRIVANPGTLTGSIGVIMEFLNMEGLFRWLGLKTRVVKSGEYKDIGSPMRELTPAEQRLLQEVVDDVHGQFVSAVSEARGLPPEKVRTFADGRIFSGRRAQELGLVDELGGFRDAVRVAAKMGGIEGEPNLVYPKKKRSEAFELFFSEMLSALRRAVRESAQDGESGVALDYR